MKIHVTLMQPKFKYNLDSSVGGYDITSAQLNVSSNEIESIVHAVRKWGVAMMHLYYKKRITAGDVIVKVRNPSLRIRIDKNWFNHDVSYFKNDRFYSAVSLELNGRAFHVSYVDIQALNYINSIKDMLYDWGVAVMHKYNKDFIGKVQVNIERFPNITVNLQPEDYDMLATPKNKSYFVNIF